jgi:hypothetical protein
MSKENSRPWYRNPVYLGLIGAVIAAVIAAIIGATWTFWLNPPPSDFSISVKPMKGEVYQGGVISTAITIEGIQGYEHQVRLEASGQPPGIVVTLVPQIGGPTPSYISTVTINVDPIVPAGDYEIVKKGRGADGKEHSCIYTLTVKPSVTPSSSVTTTPSPTHIITPTPASSTTPTPTPGPETEPTATPTPTPHATARPTPTPGPETEPTPHATSTPTATTLVTLTLTPTPTPTPTTPLMPDLFVSEFSLDPSTPIQGSPVSIRVGVYNKGNDRSGAFTVQWWAGENFKEPACTWQVDSLAARGGRILTCSYEGYTSWYGSLTTKVVVDSAEEVAESNEENNEYRKTIAVIEPSGVHIVFDALPDGTPISSDLILNGDEFLSKGIRLEGAPEGTYCSDAVAAILCSEPRKNFNFLTTARPDNVRACHTVPVAIIFGKQVHLVTLIFAGASTTYTMKAYDSAGNLLGTVEQDALVDGGTFEVTFSSKSDINRVTFGRELALTAIKEIYYDL